MKNLFAVALLAMGVFAVGCGGNDCEDAADRVADKSEECGIAVTTTEGGEEVECTDALGKSSQKFADCYEAASCDVLNAKGTAEDTKKYTDCLAAQ